MKFTDAEIDRQRQANIEHELRQDIEELRAEVERLNQMLRDTGYGQGQIDAYVAQCEELDSLRAANK